MARQFLDQLARLPATAADVERRFDPRGDDWWMTDAERLALTGLLSQIRPALAIEIGVFRAGSLTPIARFADKVYALDIDPSCQARFHDKFTNVEFVTGDAAETLPTLLTRLQATRAPLGFILLDAEHSRDGVRRDIDNILRYVPERPLYVLMHDSFNPECRRGMREAAWAANPHVHLVELDFVPGRFVTREEDGFRQMWCGFALAVLLPERRAGKLVIHENESLMFQTVRRRSVYRYQTWWNPLYLAGELRYRARNALRARAPALYESLRRAVRGLLA